MLQNVATFGAIDAESDVRLLDCFYRASIIDDLLTYNKQIIIGRKGSGKTAIYKYIKSVHSDKSVALSFRDYPWRIHDMYKNTVVSERESYVNSWIFFFYIQILRKIVISKDDIKDRKVSIKIKRLSKWLKKNWGSLDFDFKETLNLQRKSFNIVVSPQVLGNGLGSISRDLHASSNVGASLSEYNKKIEKIIAEILPYFDSQIYLLFDELDLAYTQNDESYNNKLIGLLIATYNIHSTFDKKARVYLFLRNDIFNQLQFQDKNKIKDNLVVFLDWDDDSNAVLSLRSLASSRIKDTLSLDSIDFPNNWREVFDEGTIGRNKFKWTFIIERTFMRPRDIIKFMNLALDAAKLRLEREPDSASRITNNDMHSIKSKYSTYLYEELRDEITGKYPEFNDYMEILRDMHTLTFTKDEFVEHFNNLRDKFRFEIEPDIVLNRLYEFSIIGFYKPGGGGFGGSGYRFQYASDYQAFNTQSQRFRVHHGFKEYLELIE